MQSRVTGEAMLRAAPWDLLAGIYIYEERRGYGPAMAS